MHYCIWGAMIGHHKNDGSHDSPGGRDIYHLGTNYIPDETNMQNHIFCFESLKLLKV